MTDAEQAALDLIDEMTQELVTMKDVGAEKDRQISALNDDLATFQAEASEAAAAVAQRREWFDSFRGAVFPAPAPAEEPVVA